MDVFFLLSHMTDINVWIMWIQCLVGCFCVCVCGFLGAYVWISACKRIKFFRFASRENLRRNPNQTKKKWWKNLFVCFSQIRKKNRNRKNQIKIKIKGMFQSGLFQIAWVCLWVKTRHQQTNKPTNQPNWTNMHYTISKFLLLSLLLL